MALPSGFLSGFFSLTYFQVDIKLNKIVCVSIYTYKLFYRIKDIVNKIKWANGDAKTRMTCINLAKVNICTEMQKLNPERTHALWSSVTNPPLVWWTHWAISRSSQCSTTGVTKLHLQLSQRNIVNCANIFRQKSKKSYFLFKKLMLLTLQEYSVFCLT